MIEKMNDMLISAWIRKSQIMDSVKERVKNDDGLEGAVVAVILIALFAMAAYTVATELSDSTVGFATKTTGIFGEIDLNLGK